jgi:4-hydroxybutyrate dehydrogenase
MSSSELQYRMQTIHYLTQITFDFGAIAALPAELLRCGIKKPLLMSDRGIERIGLLSQCKLQLVGIDYATFLDVPPNPTESAVMAALALYQSEGCDGLIAFGGGSVIDAAKGVAILAGNDQGQGRLADYATILGGAAKIGPTTAPVIAIPTTSGTGSEVARGAIIVLDDGRKLGFHNWNLMPKGAICDPDLTLGLPPSLTAATGMDAIAHCIETYLNAPFNPPAEGIALDGLERGLSSIETATKDGSNREARRNMMSAAMQGAMAFQKGLGCVHSLSHGLGGLAGHQLHHGTLNAVLLPAVLKFNAPVVGHKVQRLAREFGVAGDSSASPIATAVLSLNERLGLPTGLAAMGVSRNDFKYVIQNALLDHCHGTNPRIASASDYEALLSESLT